MEFKFGWYAAATEKFYKMKMELSIIALLFSMLTYGQATKEIDFNNVDGLTIADSLTWNNIVGGIYISNGFTGYKIQLDSNMTFHKIDFGCMASFTIDSGSWSIKNNRTLLLQSNKETLYFDVVKFDNFYFFILPEQRQKFINDVKTKRAKFKKAKPFTIDGKAYSVNFMIGYALVEKYYAKEIEDIAGT